MLLEEKRKRVERDCVDIFGLKDYARGDDTKKEKNYVTYISN